MPRNCHGSPRLPFAWWFSFACVSFSPFLFVAGAKMEFLKEILMGRCYYNPPTGIAGSCPSVVDYIVAGLEGHLDESITSATFSSYLAGANFRPTNNNNQGLFWLQGESSSSGSMVLLPPGWNTPEMTPGGALMDGLYFCGIDLRQDCPRISGASTVFWTNAYRAYANQVRNQVHVIVEKGAFLTPFLDAIPNFSADVLSAVTLYATDCQSGEVLTITGAFREAFNKSSSSSSSTMTGISCSENLDTLAICQDPTSAACQCLTRPVEPPKPIGPDSVVVNVTVEVTDSMLTQIPNVSTGTAALTVQHNDTRKSNKVLVCWVLVLIVFFLGLCYALVWRRRQEMKGYQPIPVHVAKKPSTAQQ